MAEFKKVAKLTDLNEDTVVGVRVGNKEIALYLQDGQVFATDDICAHEACVISENFALHGEEVECTCHGSHYNIKTGENTVPPASDSLRTFQTKVEDGEVWVEV